MLVSPATTGFALHRLLRLRVSNSKPRTIGPGITSQTLEQVAQSLERDESHATVKPIKWQIRIPTQPKKSYKIPLTHATRLFLFNPLPSHPPFVFAL